MPASSVFATPVLKTMAQAATAAESAATPAAGIPAQPGPDAATAAPATADAIQQDRLPEDGIDLREHMARIELNLIRDALERAGGVVAHAAQLLGLRRTTLVEKLRKYGVERDEAALLPET